MPEVIVAGFSLFPDQVDVDALWVGGNVERALDGTGYGRIVDEAPTVTLGWGFMLPDERAYLVAALEAAKRASVTITCSDPVISGTFLLASRVRGIKPVDGPTEAYSGSLMFEGV